MACCSSSTATCTQLREQRDTTRDDPRPDAGPTFDDIQTQLEDERVNKRAQTYLRDLRRDAIIDYD